MSTVAKDVIIPEEGTFRAVFLYVGQGDATLLVVPDGGKRKYVLIDSNHGESCGGIDLIKLFKDLFKEETDKIDVYINTHPHKDHLSKIKELYEDIGIKQIWHSGHKPGGEHKDVYKDLEYVMTKLGKENVFCLKGSREENKLDDKELKLGDVNYNVLAPAEYIADEITYEKPEDRYNRIHEQCGVIKFKYGEKEKQILITGDADYDAWKEHITDYHKDRLPSTILSAAHHGSNSFFWKNSDTEEEPYKDHLNKINPTYIVVSAPKRSESRHEHPDEKAMNIYKDKVGADNVFHLGKKRECIIVDIDKSGEIYLDIDYDLVNTYGIKNNGEDNGGKKEAMSPAVLTSLDKKAMGM